MAYTYQDLVRVGTVNELLAMLISGQYPDGAPISGAAAGLGLTPLPQATVPLSATTPTPLSATSVPCKQVLVMGAPTMQGSSVGIGIAGAGNQLVPLASGQIVFLPVANVNLLYGLASAGNDQDAVIYWPFR